MRRLSYLLLAVIVISDTLPFRVWAAAAEDIAFYKPCWCDASGNNGKGGVSLVTAGKDHKLVLGQDTCKEKTGSEAQVVFDSDNNNGNCLSFEFTWVTTPATSSGATNGPVAGWPSTIPGGRWTCPRPSTWSFTSRPTPRA